MNETALWFRHKVWPRTIKTSCLTALLAYAFKSKQERYSYTCLREKYEHNLKSECLSLMLKKAKSQADQRLILESFSQKRYL